MSSTNITCEQFRNQLKAYFEGDLDSILEAQMDDHRQNCDECREAHGSMADERLDQYGPLGLMVSRGDADACLTEEVLRKYHEGLLTEEEKAYVRDHAAECFSCGIQIDNMKRP